MGGARTVAARCCRRHVAAHVEFGEAKENDLFVGSELHLDQRIVARLCGDDRVHDAGIADMTAMDVREVGWFDVRRADDHRFPYQDRRPFAHEKSP